MDFIVKSCKYIFGTFINKIASLIKFVDITKYLMSLFFILFINLSFKKFIILF
jgi:hypothetical protein